MNKRTLLLVVVLTAVLLLVSLSAVSAEPSAIECDLEINYDEHEEGSGEFYWFGDVTGPDCTVEGDIAFFAVHDEYSYPGNTMHFVENFVIWPYAYEDSWISGKNYGVWNLSTFKYRANGWVKDASPEWAHLIGYKYHETGTTSNPADGLPYTAPGGWAKLVPANREFSP